MRTTIQYATFQQALKAFPHYISYDALSHTTIYDLAWCAQHELDLLYEGEDNDLTTPNRIKAAKIFYKRCTGKEYK